MSFEMLIAYLAGLLRACAVSLDMFGLLVTLTSVDHLVLLFVLLGLAYFNIHVLRFFVAFLIAYLSPENKSNGGRPPRPPLPPISCERQTKCHQCPLFNDEVHHVCQSSHQEPPAIVVKDKLHETHPPKAATGPSNNAKDIAEEIYRLVYQHIPNPIQKDAEQKALKTDQVIQKAKDNLETIPLTKIPPHVELEPEQPTVVMKPITINLSTPGTRWSIQRLPSVPIRVPSPAPSASSHVEPGPVQEHTLDAGQLEQKLEPVTREVPGVGALHKTTTPPISVRKTSSPWSVLKVSGARVKKLPKSRKVSKTLKFDISHLEPNPSPLLHKNSNDRETEGVLQVEEVPTGLEAPPVSMKLPLPDFSIPVNIEIPPAPQHSEASESMGVDLTDSLSPKSPVSTKLRPLPGQLPLPAFSVPATIEVPQVLQHPGIPKGTRVNLTDSLSTKTPVSIEPQPLPGQLPLPAFSVPVNIEMPASPPQQPEISEGTRFDLADSLLTELAQLKLEDGSDPDQMNQEDLIKAEPAVAIEVTNTSQPMPQEDSQMVGVESFDNIGAVYHYGPRNVMQEIATSDHVPKVDTLQGDEDIEMPDQEHDIIPNLDIDFNAYAEDLAKESNFVTIEGGDAFLARSSNMGATDENFLTQDRTDEEPAVKERMWDQFSSFLDEPTALHADESWRAFLDLEEGEIYEPVAGSYPILTQPEVQMAEVDPALEKGLDGNQTDPDTSIPATDVIDPQLSSLLPDQPQPVPELTQKQLSTLDDGFDATDADAQLERREDRDLVISLWAEIVTQLNTSLAEWPEKYRDDPDVIAMRDRILNIKPLDVMTDQQKTTFGLCTVHHWILTALKGIISITSREAEDLRGAILRGMQVTETSESSDEHKEEGGEEEEGEEEEDEDDEDDSSILSASSELSEVGSSLGSLIFRRDSLDSVSTQGSADTDTSYGEADCEKLSGEIVKANVAAAFKHHDEDWYQDLVRTYESLMKQVKSAKQGYRSIVVQLRKILDAFKNPQGNTARIALMSKIDLYRRGIVKAHNEAIKGESASFRCNSREHKEALRYRRREVESARSIYEEESAILKKQPSLSLLDTCLRRLRKAHAKLSRDPALQPDVEQHNYPDCFSGVVDNDEPHNEYPPHITELEAEVTDIQKSILKRQQKILDFYDRKCSDKMHHLLVEELETDLDVLMERMDRSQSRLKTALVDTAFERREIDYIVQRIKDLKTGDKLEHMNPKCDVDSDECGSVDSESSYQAPKAIKKDVTTSEVLSDHEEDQGLKEAEEEEEAAASSEKNGDIGYGLLPGRRRRSFSASSGDSAT